MEDALPESEPGSRQIEAAVAVEHLKRADSVLRRIIEAVGDFGLQPSSDNPFQSLARSIIFQQLSGLAAGTIYGRFVALFAPSESSPDPTVRRSDPNWKLRPAGFPTPRQVLALDEETLRSAGLSRQKAASLRSLAEHFASGELTPEHFHAWDDDEIIAHLTRVRGIGRWTAEMFLMFHLGRPDVLPVNDVGINRAIMRQYALEAMPKPDQVLATGAPWRPWATVACWYLWRSEDVKLPV